MSNRIRLLNRRLGDVLKRCINEGNKGCDAVVVVVVVVVRCFVFIWRSLASATQSAAAPAAKIPVPLPRLHASGLHKSRRSYCRLTFPISSFYTFTSIQPEAQVYNQPLQDMSNSKPYVTSSGTLGAQPLAHRISIKISDFATLAYLFFETLVSVSRAKRQIHIFYLSRIHM